MAYTHCTSLKQVLAVLRNYDGHLIKDCDRDGFWIDVDCEEHWAGDRKGIIRVTNALFKKRGWQKA